MSFSIPLGLRILQKWLVDQKWALVAIMIINIWTQIGYYVAVYMSGLKNIPIDFI